MGPEEGKKIGWKKQTLRRIQLMDREPASRKLREPPLWKQEDHRGRDDQAHFPAQTPNSLASEARVPQELCRHFTNRLMSAVHSIIQLPHHSVRKLARKLAECLPDVWIATQDGFPRHQR